MKEQNARIGIKLPSSTRERLEQMGYEKHTDLSSAVRESLEVGLDVLEGEREPDGGNPGKKNPGKGYMVTKVSKEEVSEMTAESEAVGERVFGGKGDDSAPDKKKVKEKVREIEEIRREQEEKNPVEEGEEEVADDYFHELYPWMKIRKENPGDQGAEGKKGFLGLGISNWILIPMALFAWFVWYNKWNLEETKNFMVETVDRFFPRREGLLGEPW